MILDIVWFKKYSVPTGNVNKLSIFECEIFSRREPQRSRKDPQRLPSQVSFAALCVFFAPSA